MSEEHSCVGISVDSLSFQRPGKDPKGYPSKSPVYFYSHVKDHDPSESVVVSRSGEGPENGQSLAS